MPIALITISTQPVRLVERALNAAILRADITKNFEQYLDIFDAFYTNDVEVSSESQEQPVCGTERVRALLGDSLVPIHTMAEIGGLLASVRGVSDSG